MPYTIADNSQIGNKKLICKIRYPEADSDDLYIFRATRLTDALFTKTDIRSANLSFGYCDPKSVIFRKSMYSSTVSLSSLMVYHSGSTILVVF